MTDLDVRPPPLLTRPMVLLLAAAFGSLASFYLLAPVVPLYAAEGGAGDLGAGLSTGTMMLATVLIELAMPALLRGFGYRWSFVLGMLLLAVPSVVLAASSALPLVLATCLARGAGLGIIVVAGPALIAELAPPGRRGEALGVLGVAVGVPAVVGLPLGLWLADNFGYTPVFLAAAGAALVPLIAAVGLPAERTRDQHEPGAIGFSRMALIFGVVALAAGILMTFVPLAASGGTATLALFVHAATMPVARWAAGRYGDRHGSARLLVPSVLISAAGMAGLLWEPTLIAGAAVFGIGFGIAQNATLALMFERAPASATGRTSAQWNLAYDGGMGIGAIGFGAVAGLTGYPGGFALTAAVVALALIPAWKESHAR